MAQIIKHRRGSLESVASATKRAGELLVVTGSAGITATNGNSILFVGIDGSTVTPANKILQGSSVPNLSGAAYDTSIDGIPYYDSSAEKLYILNKGGNVEVKATANTGGTGIVSGSAQVKSLLPLGTVSGSEQVTITSTSGFSTFSSSLDSRFVTISTNVTELFSTASDHESRLDTIETSIGGGSGIGLRVSNLEAYTGSQDTKNNTLASYTASIDSDLSALHTFSASVETKQSTLATYTGSVTSDLSALHTFSASQEAKDSTLASYTGSVTSDLSALHTFSGSQETKNDTLGVYTASLETKNSTLASYTASVNSDLSALHTFSGSQETKNSTLASYTASVNSDLSALHTFTQSQENLNATLATTGSNIFYGTQTITGSVYITSNLVVQGSSSLQNITASAVDIGTNTIKLNTNSPAVRFGGISVYDSGSSASTGSLFWDSLNNVWIYQNPTGEAYTSARLIAGPQNTGSLGEESGLTSGKLTVALGDDHIGDSIVTQSGGNLITIGGGLSVTGTISGSIQGIGNVAVYSQSVDSRLASVETSLGGGGSIGTRVTALEAFTASQETKNSTLASYTASVDSDISALYTYDGEQDNKNSTLATYTGSIDTKFSTLATYTGSINDQISQLIADSGSQAGRITALEIKSSSIDTKFGTLATYTASVDTNITNLNSFSSSINTTIKTKLNVEGVISGSSQVSYTGLSNIPAGIVSGSTQLDNTSISGLTLTSVQASGSFSGSHFGTFTGDGSALTGIASTLSFSGSTGNDTINLKTESLLVTGSTGITTAVSDNTITISGVDASTTQKGVASFSSTNFAVSTGNVSIKANGVLASNLNSNVAGTGISLNGVDNSIEVDYGATAGSAVEGNTSLTIQGTTHEIEIAGGAITLGNGGTVTIGLPDSVTIATASIQDDLSVGGNVNIVGNLYVQGTTTTIDSTTISLGDNIIELNGSAAANGGLLVKDVTNPNTASGSLLWDSTNDYWKGGALGSEKQFARLDGTPTSGSVQTIGANGLLVDSTISDDGAKVTIGTDLIINGLTANSFVVSNGSKKLISVTPSNAGDLIQWNGSSFVASNTIDGGTF